MYTIIVICICLHLIELNIRLKERKKLVQSFLWNQDFFFFFFFFVVDTTVTRRFKDDLRFIIFITSWSARAHVYSDCLNKDSFIHSFFSFSIQLCEDVYGIQFNRTTNQAGVNFTNTNYGGWDIHADKIVFPNGAIDPWHALGIVKSTEMYTAIYINGN